MKHGHTSAYGIGCVIDTVTELVLDLTILSRVPVSVRHVAIGKSNQELAKRNLYIFANLAKSIK